MSIDTVAQAFSSMDHTDAYGDALDEVGSTEDHHIKPPWEEDLPEVSGFVRDKTDGSIELNMGLVMEIILKVSCMEMLELLEIDSADRWSISFFGVTPEEQRERIGIDAYRIIRGIAEIIQTAQMTTSKEIDQLQNGTVLRDQLELAKKICIKRGINPEDPIVKLFLSDRRVTKLPCSAFDASYNSTKSSILMASSRSSPKGDVAVTYDTAGHPIDILIEQYLEDARQRQQKKEHSEDARSLDRADVMINAQDHGLHTPEAEFDDEPLRADLNTILDVFSSVGVFGAVAAEYLRRVRLKLVEFEMIRKRAEEELQWQSDGMTIETEAREMVDQLDGQMFWEMDRDITKTVVDELESVSDHPEETNIRKEGRFLEHYILLDSETEGITHTPKELLRIYIIDSEVVANILGLAKYLDGVPFIVLFPKSEKEELIGTLEYMGLPNVAEVVKARMDIKEEAEEST